MMFARDVDRILILVEVCIVKGHGEWQDKIQWVQVAL